MIFVDTSYFVAIANSRDSLHARAVAWAEAADQALLTTEYVLIETVDGLSAPPERSSIHQMVDALMANPFWHVVPASPALFRAGLGLHRRRTDKHWSLTDCISFEVMRSHDVRRALTYDHHFEQAGFTALLRADPSDDV